MTNLDVALTATEHASACLRQLDRDRHYQSRTNAEQIRCEIEKVHDTARRIVGQLDGALESGGMAWTGNADILG